MSGGMAGLKVLDFSMGVAGPHVGELCARHGAEVVKIESLEGDWARQLGRTYGDHSAFSVVYNEGKLSLAINLKDEAARDAVKAMAAKADVLIEAFRPGVMKKLGLSFDELSALNPGLIYLSVTGFGQTGPLSNAPATDVVLQGYTGFMYCNRDAEGVPQRIDLIIVDVLTGLYGFQAVAMALLRRSRLGGTGQYIDCSMMSSALAFQAGKVVEDIVEGGSRPMYVPMGVFETVDGLINISVRRDDHFSQLCQCLGRIDLLSDERYATGDMRVDHREALLATLRKTVRGFTTAELREKLTAAGVLNSEVHTYADVLKEEQVRAAGAVSWRSQDGFEQGIPIVHVPGTDPLDSHASSPRVGEHSEDILRTWGIDERVIADLKQRGILLV